MGKVKDMILKVLFWTFVGVFGSIALSVIYYSVFSLFFYTDVEKELSRENRIYRRELPKLEKTAVMMRQEMEFLRARDENIYRKVFEADAPSIDELIQADILTDNSDNGGNIVRNSFVKAGEATAKAEGIEADWRAVFEAIGGSGRNLPPVSSPVRNLSYTNVGASIGERLSPFYKVQMQHNGLDIIAPYGTPVRATAYGTVRNVNHSSGGKGNCVEIVHSNGYVTTYAHLARTVVQTGMAVRPGTVIGTVGDSGRAFTTHLHYEVSKDGVILDPVNFLYASVSPEEYLKMLIMSASSGQSMD